MKRRRALAMISAVGVAAAALTLAATPATAATTAPGNWYYLTNGTTGGTADITFAYGKADDVVLVGDWNGDGTDTLGVRRGNTYYLTNGTTGGTADITFSYGKADDVVLVGDWNGDGTDTLGVRRGNQYYLTNGTTGGTADITFAYGKATDVVLIGDWNGDAKDTLGVRRGNQYYLTNGTTGGTADISFAYGKSDDVVLVGDWNGDAKDTLGVRRASTYYLTNGTTGGTADITFSYGRATDIVLVGDWNGDGTDTLGVRRPAVIRNTIPAIPWNATYVRYAVPSQVAPALYRSTSFDYDGCSAETTIPMGSYDALHSIQGSDPDQPSYVRVVPTAIMFSQYRTPNSPSINGCGGWTEVLPTDAFEPRDSGSRGIYRTGHDIVPGTYRFDGWRNCTITAVRDFDGSPASNLASVVVDPSTTTSVELLPSYKGVTAAGFSFNGTACDWTKGSAGSATPLPLGPVG